MAAVAMVTKIQNGHQIQKSSDLGEIWKFVQSIPIFLAYLVPLDVDVVPI
jgi:transposase